MQEKVEGGGYCQIKAEDWANYMRGNKGFWVASTYYHRSETTYSFGPFNSDAAMNKFIKSDPEPDSHDGWNIIYVNHPSYYHSGNEIGSHNWTWGNET